MLNQPNNKIRLSVAIITFNEERKLAGTLRAVQDFADEIIIVDSFSEDGTVSIAQSFGAKVIQKKWEGFSIQKTFLLEHCHGDWVLLIDADEVLDARLIDEINTTVFNGTDPAEVYELVFRSYCFGYPINYGGWSGFHKIRLFKRGWVTFGGELVHERFIVKEGARTKKLLNPIHHYTYSDMEECIDKYNRYSSAGARDLISKGKRPSISKLFLAPAAVFIKRYFLKLGFLDGIMGFILAVYMAGYDFAKYAKLFSLVDKKKY